MVYVLKSKITYPSGRSCFPNSGTFRTANLRVTFTQWEIPRNSFPSRDHLHQNYFERADMIGRDLTQLVTAWLSKSKVSGSSDWKEKNTENQSFTVI